MTDSSMTPPEKRPSRNCIVVCGPTATGKTTLGVELALDVGGEILSADPRQVYRRMDLASGKDLVEYTTPRGTVPYHLIDVADPEEIYSLFDYQRDFYRVFEEVTSRGRLPVVVGGTGLYIEATLRKFRVPDVPPDEPFRAEMQKRDLDDLTRDLESRAPEIARRTVLDCKRRVIRALEVARHTERAGEPPVNRTDVEFRPVLLVVTCPREELRRRIRIRLLARLDAGMVEEVRGILERGISRQRFNLFGMEQRHVARFLDGEVSRDAMIEDLISDIC
ncbi:MAG: tRNA (adenosine(37)-N6)-dimethylallyltransferase, partial [Planctomycetota bacterium]